MPRKRQHRYAFYLDDEEMNLKQSFVSLVFLDCVKAKNFSYCNRLLSEELKMKNVENIKEFFEAFDWFYPINEKTVVLINKNTLAGIYEFECKDNLIFNTSYEGSPTGGKVKIPVRDTEVVVGDYDKAKGMELGAGSTTYIDLDLNHDKAVNEIIDNYDAASVVYCLQ